MTSAMQQLSLVSVSPLRRWQWRSSFLTDLQWWLGIAQAIHRAFVALGGLTILSAWFFRVKRDDGASVSRHHDGVLTLP
jgi:hypothetical protein